MSLRCVSIELKVEELEGNYLVISCTINKDSPNNVPTYTGIDCSATGYTFIDDEFVRYYFLPRYHVKTERELEVINGRLIKSENITYMIKISLSIKGHEERMPAFITHLGHYPLVLRKPWLKRHDVSIRFATDMVIFDSPYYLNNCTEHGVQIKGIIIDTPEHISAVPPPLPLPHTLPVPPMSASTICPTSASTVSLMSASAMSPTLASTVSL